MERTEMAAERRRRRARTFNGSKNLHNTRLMYTSLGHGNISDAAVRARQTPKLRITVYVSEYADRRPFSSPVTCKCTAAFDNWSGANDISFARCSSLLDCQSDEIRCDICLRVSPNLHTSRVSRVMAFEYGAAYSKVRMFQRVHTARKMYPLCASWFRNRVLANFRKHTQK